MTEGLQMVTDTLQGTDVATTVPTPAPVMTRESLIARLIAEADRVAVALTREGAEMIVELWARAQTDFLKQFRPGGRRVETLLTGDELRLAHPAMDRLMADDMAAERGSVHEALDAFTFGVDLVTGRPVRGVIHTLDSFDRCAVVVSVA